MARTGIAERLIHVAEGAFGLADGIDALHATGALIGADVATTPPAVLWSLAKHPLTDKGLDAFLKDWAATGQLIL